MGSRVRASSPAPPDTKTPHKRGVLHPWTALATPFYAASHRSWTRGTFDNLHRRRDDGAAMTPRDVSRSPSRRIRFVGRQRELAVLDERLQAPPPAASTAFFF